MAVKLFASQIVRNEITLKLILNRSYGYLLDFTLAQKCSLRHTKQSVA
ncbi:MAG: hypothetical protein HFE34_00910 [Clostridia bacterium]|nr:hypothetical protein [Clostridia bacterium]